MPKKSKMNQSTQNQSEFYDKKSEDLPATRKMLYLVQQNMKSEFRSLRSEIDHRFCAVDAQLHKMAAEISRVGLLVEEQNANNRLVLEGLSGLFHRQDRVEKRMDGIETWVKDALRRT
jgi:hypothetical protein